MAQNAELRLASIPSRAVLIKNGYGRKYNNSHNYFEIIENGNYQAALSERCCRQWFHNFKNGEGKIRSGREKM